VTAGRYATAADFRRALEDRLRAGARSPVEVASRRQLLAFDRLLVRIEKALGSRALLKGGLALELRMEGARTTADVDLRLAVSPDRVVGALQGALALDPGDFFRFGLVPHPRTPKFAGEGVPYEGLRFRVSCSLADRLFVHPFGLDIGFGDPLVGEIEVRDGPDVLAFAGIAPPRVRLYPVETHIAEKVHAYTLPRARTNSRVKDLPDIALLASSRELSGALLMRAFVTTFGYRASHALPVFLESPPEAWGAPYRALAELDRLRWPDLHTVTRAVRDFLDPVLDGQDVGTWDPRAWTWIPNE